MKRQRGRKVLCSCGRTTQSLNGVCFTCHHASAPPEKIRRRQTCAECKRGCRTVSGLCAECRLLDNSPVELGEGEWVRRGLTWYFVPGQPSEVVEPARIKRRSVKPPCGTEPSYQWHRRNDTDAWPLPADDPCGCRAAHTAHEAFRTAMKERPDMKEAS